MNSRDLATLLLENGPIALRTRTSIYAKGPESVEGEAYVDWTARLDAGSSGIGGIEVSVVKVHAYGDRLRVRISTSPEDEDETQPFDIWYPPRPGEFPDEATADDILDIASDRPWQLEVSMGDRFPRRPCDVEINFKHKILTVIFE